MFGVENDPEVAQPRLKGQAGELKHLTKALLHVWEGHRGTSVVHQQISLLLKKFIVLDGILDEHPAHVYPKLPQAAANDFETAGFSAAALLNAIADHYMRVDPKPLFNLTIKAHYFIHIAIQARFVNPRLAICYGGEDYMHHMKRMVQSCCRATTAQNIGKKMLDKIRLAMHVEMRE